jgi:hypothetical protein
MQINEWGNKYMQIIRNLKRKRIKETQVKFDKSEAIPTLQNVTEQDLKGCTPYGSTLKLPMGEGVTHRTVH